MLCADINPARMEPDPEMDNCAAAAIEAEGSWARKPHHLLLGDMWQEIQREGREQLVGFTTLPNRLVMLNHDKKAAPLLLHGMWQEMQRKAHSRW